MLALSGSDTAESELIPLFREPGAQGRGLVNIHGGQSQGRSHALSQPQVPAGTFHDNDRMMGLDGVGEGRRCPLAGREQGVQEVWQWAPCSSSAHPCVCRQAVWEAVSPSGGSWSDLLLSY